MIYLHIPILGLKRTIEDESHCDVHLVTRPSAKTHPWATVLFTGHGKERLYKYH